MSDFQATSARLTPPPPPSRYRNPVVANLSLMALGSSAPEILLNVIEITTGKFMAGDLGPSTIVGSAAFNLLVILGVCVAAITEGTRRIEEMKAPAPPLHIPLHKSLHTPQLTPQRIPSPRPCTHSSALPHVLCGRALCTLSAAVPQHTRVPRAPRPPAPRPACRRPPSPAPPLQVYAITAITSMFAYIWLLIMLMVWTPDRITVAEGVITFAMFWVLLFAAYAAEKDFFRAKKPVAPEDEDYTGPAPTPNVTGAEDDVAVKNALKMTNGMAGMDELDDDAKVDLIQEAMRPVTAATHTRNAMAWLTGKRPRPVFDAETGTISGMGGGIMKNPDGTPMKNPDGSPMKSASPKGRGTPSPNRMRTEANMALPVAKVYFETEAVDIMEDAGSVTLVTPHAQHDPGPRAVPEALPPRAVPGLGSCASSGRAPGGSRRPNAPRGNTGATGPPASGARVSRLPSRRPVAQPHHLWLCRWCAGPAIWATSSASITRPPTSPPPRARTMRPPRALSPSRSADAPCSAPRDASRDAARDARMLDARMLDARMRCTLHPVAHRAPRGSSRSPLYRTP